MVRVEVGAARDRRFGGVVHDREPRRFEEKESGAVELL
jgi:hypothetical protein